MTFKNLIEGLTILAKYAPKKLESCLGGADHDVVYILPEDDAPGITDDDRKALDDLGFYLDDNGWYIFP